MVIHLDGPVLGGVLVPDVAARLPDPILARRGDLDLPGFQAGRRLPDAVQHGVVRRDHVVPPPPAEHGDHRRRRRVNDGPQLPPLVAQALRELVQVVSVLLVGLLGALVPSAVVVLVDLIPGRAVQRPQPGGKGVHGAVVDGQHVLRRLPFRRLCHGGLIHGIDQALSQGPLPQNVPLVIDGPGVLLAEVVHKLRRQEGVVKDCVPLAENVRSALQKALKPVVRPLWVVGPVEAGPGLVQAALQQLEDVGGPVRHLVAVGVLDGGATELRHLADLLGPQAVAPLPEDPGGVVAGDRPHQLITVQGPHGLQHVPLDGGLGHAQDHRQAVFSGPLPDSRGDHPLEVQVRLPRAGGPALEVPAVMALTDKLDLLRRQRIR